MNYLNLHWWWWDQDSPGYCRAMLLRHIGPQYCNGYCTSHTRTSDPESDNYRTYQPWPHICRLSLKQGSNNLIYMSHIMSEDVTCWIKLMDYYNKLIYHKICDSINQPLFVTQRTTWTYPTGSHKFEKSVCIMIMHCALIMLQFHQVAWFRCTCILGFTGINFHTRLHYSNII